MKRMFLFSAFLLCAIFSASAQSHFVQEKDYESFKNVNVADKFVVKLKHSSKYSVRITSDERISPYIQTYVKNGTLWLVLDEKSYTPELKKELKQKGTEAPLLEAEISMPTIKSLVIKDKAILTHCDRLHAESFSLTVGDNAKVSSFNLDCSNAELSCVKNGVVSADVSVSGKLRVSASNSAEISLVQAGGSLIIETGGSSVVKAKANVTDAELSVSNGSRVSVSGKASSIKVKASGLSMTDLENLEAKEGTVEQSNSSKCYVNVTNSLSVNLTGGAMLSYMKKPSIEVERIISSTLIKADDPKRK